MDMRIFFTALSVGAALVVPAAAFAEEPTTTDHKNAAKECKALLKAAGSKQNLASTLGLTVNKNAKNAYGKCVSKLAREEAAERKAARSNAAKDCKAEQADQNFAATHDGKTFGQFYEAKNDSSAYGKCVSTKARANKSESDEADENRTNAAKSCRAEQKADAAKFASDYGTRRNAFGKCVSRKAQAQNDTQS